MFAWQPLHRAVLRRMVKCEGPPRLESCVGIARNAVVPISSRCHGNLQQDAARHERERFYPR